MTIDTIPGDRAFRANVIGIVALAALIFSATASSAQQGSCQGGACTKSVTVRPGGSVVLAEGISFYRNDCSFETPNIKTTTAPRQGRIVPKIVPKIIPARTARSNSTGPCAGRPTKGLQITYIANRNASGSDEVALAASSATYPDPITARIFITIQP